MLPSLTLVLPKRVFALLTVSLAIASCSMALPGRESSARDPIVRVKLIAFNDFHGNLESPNAVIRAPAIDHAAGADEVSVPAGGIARFATLVARLREQNPNNAVVSSGDIVAASPLISALFLDEPTIEAMNSIGVDFSSVGNHEFDRGVDELNRKQRGGCERFVAALAPCQGGHQFSGAKFQYLAANVTDRLTGKSIFPAYGVKVFDGVKIGFIGLTLKGTDQLVDQAGITGVTFGDEATTINQQAATLRDQGVSAIVVLIHEGGFTKGRLNDLSCPGLSGDILPILDRLDPRIDVVASAHTHQPYVCSYHGFLLTSAASYGRLLTNIDLEIDRLSGRVVRRKATNLIVASESFGMTPAQLGYPMVSRDLRIDDQVGVYRAKVATIANRKVGQIQTTLTKREDDAGQSPLGEVIADANLAATRGSGARLALLNPGGVRAPVEFTSDGAVTYGALFQSQPFGNSLVTMTLTGEQIRDVLEQQWAVGRQEAQMLQVSQGFRYAYMLTRPIGSRVVDGSITIDGEKLDPIRSYRVTVNSFMASGAMASLC